MLSAVQKPKLYYSKPKLNDGPSYLASKSEVELKINKRKAKEKFKSKIIDVADDNSYGGKVKIGKGEKFKGFGKKDGKYYKYKIGRKKASEKQISEKKAKTMAKRFRKQQKRL